MSESGDLLTLAEQNGFELLITTDQNLRYQQNLSNRKLAVLVLMSTSWPRIQSKISIIQQRISKMTL
ncbi:MAG: hypothetical protein WBA23_09660, partial [Tunicatimonas sp.]|uniref:hypothetical protein n=1 Tax=Tunicatimonas sp. TaxID=1940096 RepID=UPI003C782742